MERGIAICLRKKIREKERSEAAAIRTSDATSENHDTGTYIRTVFCLGLSVFFVILKLPHYLYVHYSV